MKADNEVANEVADRMREHGYTKPLTVRYRRVAEAGYSRVTISPKGDDRWSQTALYALVEIVTAAFSEDHRWSIVTEAEPLRVVFRWYRTGPE